MPVWSYLERGGKRACEVWHRRAGKDEFCLHWAAVAAFQRIGGYWHMLPQASQARKAIWDAINPHTGKRRIDEAFPLALRETTRENEMFIRFKNGSTWQVIGSDNFNSLVGSPPIGVVYSEYALADPAAWAFLRPIMAENGGWALFVSTPRGRNHMAKLYEYAKHSPDWHADKLNVEDTRAIPLDVIDRERRELIAERGEAEAEALIQQEYYCSFDAAIPGAYYAALLNRLEQAGHVGAVPYDPAYPVVTAWDLGIGDSTSIWFAQFVGREVRLIDYYETNGVGLDHYAKVLADKGYYYEKHYLPHDADAKELGTGTTRVETLKKLGIRATVLPIAAIDDGINAVRNLLPRSYFDAAKCERGLDCLRNYQRKWNDDLKIFGDKPLHDWASHGSDSFRYLAMAALKHGPERKVSGMRQQAVSDYNIFG